MYPRNMFVCIPAYFYAHTYHMYERICRWVIMAVPRLCFTAFVVLDKKRVILGAACVGAFVGGFDLSYFARAQSLMLLSTGERLRMARDALAERLKVLVAKSALSQLGD